MMMNNMMNLLPRTDEGAARTTFRGRRGTGGRSNPPTPLVVALLWLVVVVLPNNGSNAFSSTTTLQFSSSSPRTRKTTTTSGSNSNGRQIPLVLPLDATSLLDPSGGSSSTSTTPLVVRTSSLLPSPPSSLRGRVSSFLERFSTRTRRGGDASATNSITATTATPSKVPSYRKLLVFASTTLLIWLSEPLLSLVDTTVVGWSTKGSAGVVQLAAMGPATTLMDMLLYMTYFLALSTTNLVSQGVAERQWRRVQRTTSHILSVAAVLGAAVTALLWSPLGVTLLRSMAGATAATQPELLQYAVQYSRIRAAVAPLAVMGMVAQSFCLANLNTAAPALAVLVASVLNVSGDLALSHLGVVGAAVATAVATSCASILLLVAVRRKLNEWRGHEVREFHDNMEQRKQQQQEEELKQQEEQAAAAAAAASMQVTMERVDVDEVNEDEQSVQVLLASSSSSLTSESQQQLTTQQTDDASQLAMVEKEEPPKRVPFLSFPDTKSLLQLATISGPLAFNMIAKMGMYSALTLRTATFGSAAALAAHNVLMRLFYFFGCFADSMGMSAQAFLPASLYPLDKKAVRGTLRRLSVIALVTAAGIGVGSMQLLSRAGHFLARDALMLRAMQSQSLWLGVALFLHPLIVLREGTVIAMRDFKNLMRTYACTMLLHTTILCRTTSFPGIWQAMVAFQLARMINYRLWRTSRSKMHLETSSAAEVSSSLSEARSSVTVVEVHELDAATAGTAAATL